MKYLKMYIIEIKKIPVFSFLALIILIHDFSYNQSPGETLFIKNCQVCHTIGQGRLVGPDLLNIQDKRNENWLIEFIRSSQNLIGKNDQDAVEIFIEYNKLIMPDHNFTDAEIKGILAFIKEKSSLPEGYTQQLVDGTEKISVEQKNAAIIVGQNLYKGKIDFENHGPACIVCHNVVNDNVVNGGLLAIDLTNASTRLSEQGITSIILNPPFPVMKKAYDNHQISEEEATNLAAFLKEVDFVAPVQEPDFSRRFFIFEGLLGSIILFAIFSSIWRKRKREPVNKNILDRK